MSGLREYLAGENDGPGGTSMPGRKTCVTCGGPKPPGRGRRFCDACRPAPTRKGGPTPCRKCGSTENKLPAMVHCEECRALAQWRYERRKKAKRNQKPCVRCGGRKEATQGRRMCEACRAKVAEPPRCRECQQHPVRATGMNLCEACARLSLLRRREQHRAASRRRRELLLEEERARVRESAQRRRRDPVKNARDLETRRLRYRLHAMRQGRTVKPRPVEMGDGFDLPARPLALVFAELAAGTDLGTVCDLASVGERVVSRWRTGASETITSTEADAILTALDLLWWEVWREGTVRRPLFVVHVYTHQMKTVRGKPKMRRIKQHRLPYGDQGPDLVALAEIATRMSGEALAA